MIRNSRKQFLFILPIERWLSNEHLVQQHSVGPPVDRLSVRLVQNDLQSNRRLNPPKRTQNYPTNLRRDIVRRAAERLRGLIARDALLAHAKVGDLDMSVLVQQHVVQLQVAVHDATGVQIKQPDRDFRRVKTMESSGEGRGLKLDRTVDCGHRSKPCARGH